MKIKAAVTHGQGQSFILEEVDLAAPKANEVLVKIVATGVCHTDAVARIRSCTTTCRTWT